MKEKCTGTRARRTPGRTARAGLQTEPYATQAVINTAHAPPVLSTVVKRCRRSSKGAVTILIRALQTQQSGACNELTWARPSKP